MMHKFKTTSSGFSLLEIILYLGILSTLVFGIGLFINLVSVARVKSQVVAEVDQQALQIMEVMTRTIRNAESVSVPSIGQTQGSLRVLDSDNSLVEFLLADGDIVINNGVSSVNLNNERVVVDSLEFKDLSRAGTQAIIQISFSLAYDGDTESQMYSYSKNYVTAASLFK